MRTAPLRSSASCAKLPWVDALTPFDVRVRGAVQRILARKAWTEVQRKWLKRIEEQLLREVVVDRASIDEEPFRATEGFSGSTRFLVDSWKLFWAILTKNSGEWRPDEREW